MFKNHNYTARYKAISKLIDDNSSVLDVCCGDSKLYYFLKQKNVNYTGLDFNPTFVNNSKRRGIDARIFNLNTDKLPQSEFVVFQASLYQFIPNHSSILKKLFDAADRYLIISEPVRNYAQSNKKIISFIGKILNNPGDSIKTHRFSLQTLKDALAPYKSYIINESILKGNIECLIVIRKY